MELSETQLSSALADTDLNDDEIEIITNCVQAYLEFAEIMKTVGPLVLSADAIKKEIQEKKLARECSNR